MDLISFTKFEIGPFSMKHPPKLGPILRVGIHIAAGLHLMGVLVVGGRRQMMMMGMRMRMMVGRLGGRMAATIRLVPVVIGKLTVAIGHAQRRRHFRPLFGRQFGVVLGGYFREICKDSDMFRQMHACATNKNILCVTLMQRMHRVGEILRTTIERLEAGKGRTDRCRTARRRCGRR